MHKTPQSFGQFHPSAQEYIITNPATPRDWYNYLWNPSYVTFISQVAQGESLVQDSLGRRIAVLSSRMVFLRDCQTNEFWTLNALPVDQDRSAYRCRHGMGYTIIEQTRQGIASSLRCFVPSADPCEIWTIRLHNTSSHTRKLKLFAFLNTTIDGYAKPQSYFMADGRFDQILQAVILHNRQGFAQSNDVYVHFSLSTPVCGYDCALSSFVGYGTEQRPDAVVRGHCGNQEAQMEKCACALETPLELAPGQEITLHAIAGGAISLADIAQLRQKYTQNALVEQELALVRQNIARQLGSDQLQTPDPTLNNFFAPWLKRQITLGTQWARVRHNGFRDQMQDIAALSLFNAEDARRQLHRVLSYQYSNGYAPRTWIDGQIRDKDFADNHVWIAYSVHQLIMETGNLALLEEPIPFNDSSVASLYEHVKRALDYYWNDRGLYGLMRIRSGDWNDCMNLVGPAGKGISIWLTMAWYLANTQFAQLARLTNRAADADLADQRGQEIRQLVDQHGWDGRWYRRAYDDHGRVLGSQQNTQGTLFLLPQAWAILSGIALGDKGLQAMQAVDELLEIDLGTIKVLKAYDHWQPDIGYMTLKTPGIQENGGVYLHASAFKLVADCMLKRHDKVSLALHKMLPFDHTCWTKQCEPYVFSNSYYAIINSYRYGMPGQSWGTGTAGWFYYALVNYIFGLHPEIEGLRIDPCLPPEWKHCSLTRHFRGTCYEIEFDQSQGYRKVAGLLVDGKPATSPILPLTPGRTCKIKVIMS